MKIIDGKFGKPNKEDDYHDLWYTARKCLKEYLEAEEEKSDE